MYDARGTPFALSILVQNMGLETQSSLIQIKQATVQVRCNPSMLEVSPRTRRTFNRRCTLLPTNLCA